METFKERSNRTTIWSLINDDKIDGIIAKLDIEEVSLILQEILVVVNMDEVEELQETLTAEIMKKYNGGK